MKNVCFYENMEYSKRIAHDETTNRKRYPTITSLHEQCPGKPDKFPFPKEA